MYTQSFNVPDADAASGSALKAVPHDAELQAQEPKPAPAAVPKATPVRPSATRPAAAALAFAMLVAIFSVHFENGLFMSNNGYEFGLALLAASVSLLFSGAGKVSVDALISRKH